MTAPQTLSPFDAPQYPPLPADAVARERTIAARERVREASAYLLRMTEQYGARHPETVFAQQLLDDANLTAAQDGEVAR